MFNSFLLKGRSSFPLSPVFRAFLNCKKCKEKPYRHFLLSVFTLLPTDFGKNLFFQLAALKVACGSDWLNFTWNEQSYFWLAPAFFQRTTSLLVLCHTHHLEHQVSLITETGVDSGCAVRHVAAKSEDRGYMGK